MLSEITNYSANSFFINSLFSLRSAKSSVRIYDAIYGCLPTVCYFWLVVQWDETCPPGQFHSIKLSSPVNTEENLRHHRSIWNSSRTFNAETTTAMVQRERLWLGGLANFPITFGDEVRTIRAKIVQGS